MVLSKLTVSGNAHFGDAYDATGYGQVQITRPASQGNTHNLAFVRSATSVAGLGFLNNSSTIGLINGGNNTVTTGLFIDTSGRIGIGTNAPDSDSLVQMVATGAVSLYMSGTLASDIGGLGIGINSILFLQNSFAPAAGSLVSAAIYNNSQFNIPTTKTTGLATSHYIENLFGSHAGTITTYAGIYITTTGTIGGGGTITTAYGIYVKTPLAGTNNYCAYFQGKVGIGTATPAYITEISTATASDGLKISQTGTGEVWFKMGRTAGTTTEWGIVLSSGSSDINFYNSTSTKTSLTLSASGNAVAGPSGALATTATDGFMYISTCSGTPTGTPTSYSGKVAMFYDTSTDKFYIYNGAWRGVVIT